MCKLLSKDFCCSRDISQYLNKELLPGYIVHSLSHRDHSPSIPAIVFRCDMHHPGALDLIS